jgi:hypothetical protein
MQNTDEQFAEIKPVMLQDALMASISSRGEMGREQLLDMVFRAYDAAINELIKSGKVAVKKAPRNESHLDLFVVKCKKQ